jgi:outer membrane protein OmpA-like peptidoglycan-associated protein
MVKDYVGSNDWNIMPSVFVSASRYMNYGLSLKATGSFNEINTSVSKDDVDGLSFLALDVAAVYDLNHLFGQTGWWDPYVSFGVGGASIDGHSVLTVSPGWGFNSWFNDKYGIAFNSTYNSGSATGEFESINATSYFQHSLGLIIKFGGPSKKDTDGDGVVDEKDLCLSAAGTKENGGCPDTDGDTVLDKDDACPNAAGTKENGGCPDTDGDSVLDKDDACPNVAGPVENKGCVWPDTDGDGVADKDDKCPEVVGTFEKQGCPELTETQIKELGAYSKQIGFNSGKATFKSGVTAQLNDLAKIMLVYPTTSFVINGYTDSTGSEGKNLDISKKRAKAVKDYLVSQGVDANRLKSEGFGIKNPIATNKTSKGRATNRRVEIIAQ